MDSVEYAAAVAAKIERSVKAAGETQASISKKTGIPRTTLQRKLACDGAHPLSVREMKDIARALGWSACDLARVYEVTSSAKNAA